MTRLFSEQYGYKPVREGPQMECLDDALRRSLWNVYFLHFVETLGPDEYGGPCYYGNIGDLDAVLLTEIFEGTLDVIPHPSQTFDLVKDKFLKGIWFEVLDLILIVSRESEPQLGQDFRKECNAAFQRHVSAYRFVGDRIAPITNQHEIAEIETAMKSPLMGVRDHIRTALSLFADRENPDYRNSMKEAISAVEAICKIIAFDENATLGQALKAVKQRVGLHPALESGFSSLYGYTCKSDGIRHGLMDESNLCGEDARYFIISCSAFVNYLTEKAQKAGIEL
ncbi:MAG: hypothetical protein JW941_10810 [Candidatus Coatesbacteria bacterium]|nr:hypothetical protein [Candidatus Coatesbacteria bacterium]